MTSRVDVAQARSSDSAGVDLERLAVLGPKEPWHVALLLPRTGGDLSPVIDTYERDALLARTGGQVLLRGYHESRLNVHYQPVPRVGGISRTPGDKTSPLPYWAIALRRRVGSRRWAWICACGGGSMSAAIARGNIGPWGVCDDKILTG
ncbi:MAG: hypothetical protein L0H73_07810 [Nitrococcus sp.]|nr:hypothetical protein [Nitrococcus sp.]